MAVPVSIDGKSILTLYYSTFQKVHKSKYNFYFNHFASLALQVAPVSYYGIWCNFVILCFRISSMEAK